jgi:predicted membrane protein
MASEERFEKTFTTGDHCELAVYNVRGAVQVTGWDRPEVTVVAVKRLGSYWGAQEAFDQTTVEMEQSGAAVNLRTRTGRTFSPFGWMGIGTTPPEVSYTIQVPRKSEIAVRIVGGAVQIVNVQGTVYAKSVSGDIHLEKLAGNIIVHGVSGTATAQEIAGNLGVRTVSGDVAVRQSRLDSLSGKTVSGDIAVESPLLPAAEYTIRTISGDARFFVPPDTRASVELNSTSGDVHCEFPCAVTESRRGHWRGTLNGGGASIHVHSVSGDLEIRQAGPQEPPPPAAEPEPAPVAAGESPEMAVLRAVERGEMSVEDALQKLGESAP